MDGMGFAQAIPMTGRPPRKRGRGVATGLSLVLHALFLLSMVAGLRVLPSPPEERPLEVRLIPEVAATPRPAPIVAPLPGREVLRPPVLSPHVAPAPHEPNVKPPPPLTLPAPEAARPGGPRPELAGPRDDDGGLLPSLTGRLGCDDPESFHLNSAQRAACENNVGRLARGSRPLQLDFAEAKRKAYERSQGCRDAGHGALPSSAGGSAATSVAGLGNVQSLRECPPSAY